MPNPNLYKTLEKEVDDSKEIDGVASRYQDPDPTYPNLVTLSDYIKKYSTTDQDEYINYVSEKLEVDADSPLYDLDPNSLAQAQSEFEGYFNTDTITRARRNNNYGNLRAGNITAVDPEQRTMQQYRALQRARQLYGDLDNNLSVDDDGFVMFGNPDAGGKALLRQIQADQYRSRRNALTQDETLQKRTMTNELRQAKGLTDFVEQVRDTYEPVDGAQVILDKVGYNRELLDDAVQEIEQRNNNGEFENPRQMHNARLDAIVKRIQEKENLDQQLKDQASKLIQEDRYIKDSYNWAERTYSLGVSAFSRINEILFRIPEGAYTSMSLPLNWTLDALGSDYRFDYDKVPSTADFSKGKYASFPDYLMYYSSPQNLADASREIADEYSKNVNNLHRGITDYFTKGDYKGGMVSLGNNVLINLPYQLAIMGSALASGSSTGVWYAVGGAGLGTTGVKRQDLIRDPALKNMDKNYIDMNAFITGSAEALFERFGTGQAGLNLSKMYKTLRKNGNKALADKMLNFAIKSEFGHLRFYDAFVPMLVEGAEEAGVRLTENLADEYYGVTDLRDKEFDVFDGVMDSFLIGLGSGGATTGALTGATQYAGRRYEQQMEKEWQELQAGYEYAIAHKIANDKALAELEKQKILEDRNKSYNKTFGVNWVDVIDDEEIKEGFVNLFNRDERREYTESGMFDEDSAPQEQDVLPPQKLSGDEFIGRLKSLGFTDQDMLEQDLLGDRGRQIVEKGIYKVNFMQRLESVLPLDEPKTLADVIPDDGSGNVDTNLLNTLTQSQFDDTFETIGDFDDALFKYFTKTIPENTTNEELLNIIYERYGVDMLDAEQKKETQEMLETSLNKAIINELRNMADAKGEPTKWEDGSIAGTPLSRIQSMYDKLPTLDQRTSSSIEKQQYSTPAPLVYMLMKYIQDTNAKTYDVLEPTGGNGGVAVALSDLINTDVNVVFNELDPARLENAQNVFMPMNLSRENRNSFVSTNEDWLQLQETMPDNQFDALFTNPPFGSIEPIKVDMETEDGSSGKFAFTLRKLEHLIAFTAWKKLKVGGDAVIIIGGSLSKQTKADSNVPFYNALLLGNEKVEIFDLDGSYYKQMGTSYPIRVIVTTNKKPPLTTDEIQKFKPVGNKFFNDIPRIKGKSESLKWNTLWRFLDKNQTEIDETQIQEVAKQQVNKFAEESDEIEIEREVLDNRPRLRNARTISSNTEAGSQTTDDIQRVPRDASVPSEQIETDVESRGVTESTESVQSGSTDVSGGRGEREGVRVPPTTGETDDGSGLDRGSSQDETTDRGSSVRPTIPQGLEEDNLSGLDDDELIDIVGALNDIIEESAQETKGSLPDEDVVETKPDDKPIVIDQLPLEIESIDEDSPVDKKPVKIESVEEDDAKKKAEIIKGQESESGLQVAFEPISKSESFQTSMPVYLLDAYKKALNKMMEDLGIDNIDTYVQEKLNASSKKNLYQMLGAEQIESVALMIYNLEEKGLASVVGDQTGVGKGRQMMAMHRWALLNGKVPVYFTARDALFPQAYVDDAKGLRMYGVKKRTFKPFLVVTPNNGNNKFKDGDDIVFQGLSKPLQNKLMKDYDGKKTLKQLGYDAVWIPYSQVRQKNTQQDFLEKLVKNEDVVLILDESHSAGGEGATNKFMIGGVNQRKKDGEVVEDIYEGILKNAEVVYASATWAKTPANFPLYLKTGMGDAVDDPSQLIEVLMNGGVPLQQILSKSLSEQGAYIRRERSFDGIEVKRVIDEFQVEEKIKLADSIGEYLTDLLILDSIKKEAIKDSNDAVKSSGFGAQVEGYNFASQVHNLIGGIILLTKAQQIQQLTLESLKNGQKPVVSLEYTMGTFFEEFVKLNKIEVYKNKDVEDYEETSLDYSDLLIRSLNKMLAVTETDAMSGIPVNKVVKPNYFGKDFENQYNRIIKKLNSDNDALSLPVSPIDVFINKLESEGYKVVELSGRTIGYNQEKKIFHQIEKPNKADLVAQFNNGTADVVIGNTSMAEGINLHSHQDFGDTKQRVHITWQAIRDVNKQMQIMGRVNRTKQVNKPVYIIPQSPLEMEKRPFYLLQKKMSSLNANVSSNAKGDIDTDMIDMINSHGDAVANEWLAENKDKEPILNLKHSDGKADKISGFMGKLTGRMAVLSNEEQKVIYNQLENMYADRMEYLRSIGKNDLIVEDYNQWDATLVSEEVLTEGTDEANIFKSSVKLGVYDVKNLRPPYTLEQVQNMLNTPELNETRFKTDVDEYLSILKEWYTNKYEVLSTAKETASDELRNAQINNPDDEVQIQKLTRNVRKIEDAIKIIRDANSDILGYLEGNYADYKHGNIVEYAQVGMEQDVIQKTMGVVAGFKSLKGIEENPVALSRISLIILTNDSNRQLNIPLSRISSGMIMLDNRTWSTSMESAFNDAVENREKRHVITGNIMKGISYTGRGQVITFSTRDKSNIYGVLMPKGWSPSSLATDPRKVFDSPAQAKDYMQSMIDNRTSFMMQTSQGIMLTNDRYSYRPFVIAVPRNKQKYGKFYLDKQLRELTGDFATKKKFMSVSITPSSEKLDKIYKRLEELDAGKFYAQSIPEDELQSFTNWKDNHKGKGLQSTSQGFIQFGVFIEAGEIVFNGLSKKLQARGRIYGITKANFKQKFQEFKNGAKNLSDKVKQWFKDVLSNIKKWYDKNKVYMQLGAVGNIDEAVKKVRNRKLAYAHILENELQIDVDEKSQLKMRIFNSDTLADADIESIDKYIKVLKSRKNGIESPMENPIQKRTLKEVQMDKKQRPDNLIERHIEKLKKAKKLNDVRNRRALYSSIQKELKRTPEGEIFYRQYEKAQDFISEYGISNLYTLEKYMSQMNENDIHVLKEIIEGELDVKDYNLTTQAFVNWFRTLDNNFYTMGKAYINPDVKYINNHFPLVLKEEFAYVDLDTELGKEIIDHVKMVLNSRNEDPVSDAEVKEYVTEFLANYRDKGTSAYFTQHLNNNGGSVKRNYPIEFHRDEIFPEWMYDDDVYNVLRRYIHASATSIGYAKYFKRQTSQYSYALIDELTNNLKTNEEKELFRDMVQVALRLHNINEIDNVLLRASKNISTFLLSFKTAIKNFSDLGKAVAQTDSVSLLKSIKYLANDKKQQEIAGKLIGNKEIFAHTYSDIMSGGSGITKFGDRWTSFIQFKRSEKIIRQITGLSAITFMNQYVKGDKKIDDYAIRMADRFGIDIIKAKDKGRLTERQIQRIGSRAIRLAQPTLPTDKPLAWETNTAVNTITQLRSFGFHSLRWMKDFVYDEATKGNIMPAVKWTMWTTALGLTTKEAINLLFGTNEEEDESLMTKILETLFLDGHFGMISDFLFSLRFAGWMSPVIGFVVGASPSVLIDSVGAVIQSFGRFIYTPDRRTTSNKLKPVLKIAERQTLNKFPFLSQYGDQLIDSIPDRTRKRTSRRRKVRRRRNRKN